MSPGRGGDEGFKWEELPLEVYESLVPYLDGKSLLNLYLVSSSMADRVLEPYEVLPALKQEKHWKNFCLRNIDRAFFCKIFRSFVDYDRIPDDDKGDARPGEHVLSVSWTDVFYSYASYWKVLTNGGVFCQRFTDLENRMKAELLCAKASLLPEHPEPQAHYQWTTYSVGGNLILHFMFPCPTATLSKLNLVVSDPKNMEARCRRVHSVCNSGDFFLGLKIVDFPFLRENENGKIFDVERVVLTACNECICAAPLLGGITRRISWPVEPVKPEKALREQCPVFEIHDNVVVMWSIPESLVFYLLVCSPNQEGFEFCLLYRIPFCQKLRELWKTISQDSLLYLPVIEEFRGSTELMNPRAKRILDGETEYFYHPNRPSSIYYALALISPVNGVKVIKPEGSSNEPTIRHIPPQYFSSNNARKYLEHMRKPTYSGKGREMKVFCSATAIAVSWNSWRWIFGELPTIEPRSDESQKVVSHVEITHFNNGLLLVINEDIILAEVNVINIYNSTSIGNSTPDCELEVKPLRHIKTGIATLGRQITQIELDFDQGRPFFLVMTKGEHENNADKEEMKALEFDFALMRVDFGN